MYRDIGNIYLEMESMIESRNRKRDLNVRLNHWKSKENEFLKDLLCPRNDDPSDRGGKLRRLDSYFKKPESPSSISNHKLSTQKFIKIFAQIQKLKIFSLATGMTVQIFEDAILKFSFYPYHRGHLEGIFNIFIKDSTIIKSNFENEDVCPYLQLFENSITSTSTPQDYSKWATSVLLHLKAYYSRKYQMMEMLDIARNSGMISAISSNSSYSSISFDFRAVDEDAGSDLGVTISFNYDLDDFRPKKDSIKVVSTDENEFTEKDEIDLLDQCSDFYDYPLAEATKRAFDLD